MVCARMGMLDDAIREHLELKRRRGADPSEVAREQHEALEAPSGGETLAHDDAAEDIGDLEWEEVEEQSRGDGTPAEALPDQMTVGAGDAPAPSQETAELDMETVLDEHQPQAAEGACADPVRAPASGQAPLENSPEYEPDFASSTSVVDAGDGERILAEKEPGGRFFKDASIHDEATEERPGLIHELPGQERLSFED